MNPYYQDESCTIYHGDCLDVMPQLDAEVAMLFSDPPYCSGGLHRDSRMQNVSKKYSQNGKNLHGEWIGDSKDQRSFAAWMRAVLATGRKMLVPGGYVFTFIDWRQLPLMTDVYQAAGVVWRGICVWDKGLGTRAPHKGYARHSCEYLPWGTVGDCKARSNYGPAPGTVNLRCLVGKEKQHQVQKPIGAIVHFVQLIAEGETVLDMFAGTGSTGVAAAQVGRKSILIEAMERNCEIAAKRLQGELK